MPVFTRLKVRTTGLAKTGPPPSPLTRNRDLSGSRLPPVTPGYPRLPPVTPGYPRFDRFREEGGRGGQGGRVPVTPHSGNQCLPSLVLVTYTPPPNWD